MKLIPVDASEAVIALDAQPDIVPVQGNAMASGDDAFDHEVEQSILHRLNQGDVWAWAFVTVQASWKGFHGVAQLGCCSYANEADFCQPGGYFEDLVAEAVDDLNHQLAEAYAKLKTRLRRRR